MDSNYGATSCPGDYFYSATNRLQDIRNEVQKKLEDENRGDNSELLSPEKAKIETLTKVNQYMKKMTWFKKLPYEINTWEKEKDIINNSLIRIKISVLQGIQKDVEIGNTVIKPVFKLDLSKGATIIENPLSDWLRDKSLPEVEVVSIDEEFQTLANQMKDIGSVSVAYTMSAESFLVTIYTVRFTALQLSDGTTVDATVKISIGLKRRSIPEPQLIPIVRIQPTEAMEKVLSNLNKSAQLIARRNQNSLTSFGVDPRIAQNLAYLTYAFVLIGGLLTLVLI